MWGRSVLVMLCQCASNLRPIRANWMLMQGKMHIQPWIYVTIYTSGYTVMDMQYVKVGKGVGLSVGSDVHSYCFLREGQASLAERSGWDSKTDQAIRKSCSTAGCG
eukprot:13844201-Ditylum_brightwellii.AAC.1